MKDLTYFINNELKPRLWDHIPSIFPEMRFKKKGDKWMSNLHFDGTEGTGLKVDRSVITSRYPHRIFDNTKQESKDLITLYMELNHISEIWEAVKQLCSIVGLQEPETTPEAREKYKESEERRNALELSVERQKKALYSPEGASTLEYLHNRGWEDEEIRAAELGFISVDEASTIQAQYGIGTDYTLSIPLRSGGRIYGFKFRTINAQTLQQGKYVYLSGTSKRDNLFNLTGIKQTDGEIVVVEGELDALHAQVKGISGVVATSGGGLTEELLNAALQRGIRKVTLLFDKDERGEKFVKDSIKVAYSKGISVLVATFPDETLPNGTKIHDVDEYLMVHSAEELQTLIDGARRGGSYLLASYIEEVTAKYGKENIKDKVERDLTTRVIDLVSSIPDQTEQDIICYEYSGYIGNAITKEALQARADELRAAKDALLKKEQAEEASKKASALLKDGKVNEALSVMGEAASTLKQIGAREKYSALLALASGENLSQRIKNRQGEIPTLYEFGHPQTHEKERFTIPSGAITFVVAPTSHGKSTLLQNLALQVAETDGDGTTLYFTFEEDAESVTLQLLNKYIATELCNNYNSSHSNNLRAITHYYRKGEARFIRREQLGIFNQKRAEFFSKLYESGKLRIYYEDYDSTELIEAIRFIHSQTKVKAVFIDYIQLLSKNGNRKQRTEELKDICKDLKDLSIQTQLPIVVAAQANREVTSPLEMHSQKIAEAADLERIANKILFIWNSNFTAQKSKDSKAELDTFETRTGVKLGTSGNIYAKLTKNRGGVVNIEAVLKYNGNTGVIEPNCKPVGAEQSTLGFEDPEQCTKNVLQF